MRLSFKIRKQLGLLLTTILTALFVLSLGSQIVSKPNLASSQDQNPTTLPNSSLSKNTQVVNSASPIKNLAASGRGMKQPLLGFFRRPKGRGIYP